MTDEPRKYTRLLEKYPQGWGNDVEILCPYCHHKVEIEHINDTYHIHCIGCGQEIKGESPADVLNTIIYEECL